MVLVVVVIVLVAGMSFANLGITKNAALATNRAAHAQHDEALEQRSLLGQALDAAQRGENIVPKAFDYFVLTPPGETTVLVRPALAEESGSESKALRSAPPYWIDWWQRLAQP
jgi:hypothetical protein